MSNRKLITWQEVYEKREQNWIVIEGKVYDPKDYLNEHPGGPAVIQNRAGKDATKDFNDTGPNPAKFLRPHRWRPRQNDKILHWRYRSSIPALRRIARRHGESEWGSNRYVSSRPSPYVRRLQIVFVKYHRKTHQHSLKCCIGSLS